MQLSNIPAKLLLAFAAAGGRNDIPVDSQTSTTPGAASYTDGFPPLTRTPIVAGGTPPSGLDMNGILYELSALIRWLNAGGGFPYDSVFAADGNVGGYPKGARVMRSDGSGYWLNTVDNNTVDPESVTVGQAALAGWVPDVTSGIALITMTNANVTLTPAQYGKPVIVITGDLVADLNLIFPDIAGEWVVVNNCTGNHSITCKTSGGAGIFSNPGRTRNIYGDGSAIHLSSNEGNRQYAFIYGANQTITASQFGALLEYNGSTNATFTLPKPAGASGLGFVVWNNSTHNLTLSTPSGQFVGPGINNAASVTLKPQETLEICSDAFNYVRFGGAGSATFGSPGMFALGSGIIVQWADGYNFTGSTWQTFNWPVAFPNGGLMAVGFDRGLGLHNVATTNYTSSGFDAFAGTSGGTAMSTTFSIIAIGY